MVISGLPFRRLIPMNMDSPDRVQDKIGVLKQVDDLTAAPA